MVVAFGWGAGDLTAAVKVVYRISTEQYSEAAAFLDSFALSRVHDYTNQNPNAEYTDTIVKQVELISI